jgi:taurine--2-oxoglutarate transaminase
MSAFNKPLTPPMAAVAASLRQQGMSTFVRWNMVFCCPPLVIHEDQVKEGVDIIDRALAATDKAYEG